MRGTWICRRGLKPSTITYLFLLLTAAMLTLNILINKSTFLGKGHKLQRATLENNVANTNYVNVRETQSSTELYQYTNFRNYINKNKNIRKHDDNLIQQSHNYNQNMQRKTETSNIIIKNTDNIIFNNNSKRENKFNSYNILHNPGNFSKTLDLNKYTVQHLRAELIELSNSHKSASQLETATNTLTSFIDPASLKETLLKDASAVSSPRETVPLDKRNENKIKLLNRLKPLYIHSLNQIVKNSKIRYIYQNSIIKQETKSNFDVYNIPYNKNIETSKNVNSKYLIINTSETDHLLSSKWNTHFKTHQSETASSIENSSNVVKSRLQTFEKPPYFQQMLHSTNKHADSSRNAIKGNPSTFTNIFNGIYWSDEVEDRIPKGISTQEADMWIVKSRVMDFKSLTGASWNKCGRPKNGFALLMNGSESCVRYRSPNDRLIQGEVMSYWLARLLDLNNVPPVYMSSIDSSQWSKQQDRFQELGWIRGNIVAIILWIEDIDSRPESQVLMPELLLKAYRQKQPIERTIFDSMNVINTNKNISKPYRVLRLPDDMLEAITSVAQWGSMIIFDYLTGNYDRVASMQDGADKEKKPSIVEESIRNLRKSKNGTQLWLIDNESGLLDSYELMYQSPEHGERFVRFHDNMLQTVCVFQRRIVDRLRALHEQKNPHIFLEMYAEKQEPLLKLIERDSSYEFFQKHFSRRLDAVVKWIHVCEERVKYSL